MLKVRRVNLRWSDISMSDFSLSKLIEHYAQSNKAESKSLKTISWYSEMLMDFVEFISANNRAPILAELNVKNVREFIIHEQQRQLSPYTVHGKVRSLKAFSSWLFAEGYTQDNVLVNIKPPKLPEKIVEPLTSEEIDKLIAAQNPLTSIGCRNISILVLFLDTGIRENELCSLLFEDTHIDAGFIKVMGKGSRERIIPLGALGQKTLWRYVFHFRPEPENDENNYLFLTLDGKKLKPNAVKLLLKRWGKRAGVPRLHAHLLRHSFATNFLLYKCGDIFRLQQILGHRTLEMVRRYVHYASTQAMVNGNTATPIDKMGIKGLKGYKIDKSLKSNKS